jgi:hypothetical protein
VSGGSEARRLALALREVRRLALAWREVLAWRAVAWRENEEGGARAGGRLPFADG